MQNLSNKTIKYCFLLTIFCLPLYLIRLSFFSLPTNILEILALFSILSLLLKNPTDVLRQWQDLLRNFYLPIFLIFIGLLFSFSSNPSFLGLGIIKGWFIIPFLFSISLTIVFENKEGLDKILKVFYFSISAVAIVAIFYKLLGIMTYDGRLEAFYFSPNYLAMYLAPGILIGIYLIKKNPACFLQKIFFLFFVAILASLYFTYSYGAWIAIVLAFVSVSIIKNNVFQKKYWIIPIIILFLFFTLQTNNSKFQDFFNSKSSFQSRITIWKSALKIIKNNPILGIGPGNFQEKYLEYQQFFPPYLEWSAPQPHNLFLAFWLQTGILGLIGFLFLIFLWIKIQLHQKNTAFSAMFLGIMFYFLLHGLIDTPYWKNDLAFVFWITFFLGALPISNPVDKVFRQYD